MKVVAFLRSLASGLLHRSQMEGEMDEELRAHIANRADDLERSGLPRAESERRARIEFGGQERYKEECREERGGVWLESLWSDVRLGLRTLAKSRGFSALAVLTLALGIGANAAIFSMVNALLLHPYHFRDLDALVRMWEDRGIDEGYDARYIAPADARELSTHNEIFESVTTYEMRSFSLGAGSEIQPVLGCRVTANFFDVDIALPVSFAISRAMTSLIFGIVSMDVTILAGFTALLFLVALGAGYLPARRAMRIDPMIALRYE
jgi:hypothetical protein